MDHVLASDAQGDDDGSGFGFFVAAGSADEAAALAEVRRRFGDERADHLQRSWRRGRQRRPLAGGDREAIRRAMAPVLRDLEVTGAIVPEILYESPDDDDDTRDGREGVSTYISLDSEHGGNVWIPTEDCSFAEQVWWAAHELQEWEVHELWEHGRSTTWPECPQHPNTHPLDPDVADDAAVWRCPKTQQVICAIGALRTSD